MMKCRLCLLERPLVKSHIIPEFMYKCSGLYDGKHRILIVKKTKDVPEFQQIQKGLRERLLCEDCEGKIAKWERYARRTIYGPRRLKKASLPHHPIVLFKPIHYKTFKLFLLSMLWRMSISTLEHFSRVDLGPHEKKVRKMIFEENPGSEDDYGCIITSAIFDAGDFAKNEVLRKFMLHPERIRAHGHIHYTVFIGGLFYIFFVSKHRIPAEIQALFLNRSNQLPVLVEKAQNIPRITESLLDLRGDLHVWKRKQDRP